MDRFEQARQLFFEGIACMEREDFESAERIFRHALELVPDRASVITNLAAALVKQKKFDAARSYATQAVELDPDNAQGFLNLGACLLKAGDSGAALNAFDRALANKPEYVEAWINRGAALSCMKRYEEALACHDRALSIHPNAANVLSSLGNILRELRHYDQALAEYGKALAIKPDSAEIWCNHGRLLTDMRRQAEALVSLATAIKLKPTVEYGLGYWLHAKMRLCDWSDINEAFAQCLAFVESDKIVAVPFVLLAMPAHPMAQKRCATLYVQDQVAEPAASPFVRREQQADSGVIRVGYFSADFYNHPGMSLMAELFEIHDRAKFEVIGFSFGPADDDDMRQRVVGGLDRFIDVNDMDDRQVAALARKLGIDIAIHRNGHTRNSRSGIFAHRAAPIQVNYLGYPGTLAAGYIDYIVADPVLIPSTHRDYYTEKVAYLPHTYQPNDRKRAIAEKTPSRQELGLPDKGFVFCCFNNDYKITPDVFDIWMRLLHRVPGSVLWLLGGNEQVGANLKREAGRRGVEPSRLVFAGRVERADHLARHRQADLFVDTFYYNAHTTASDALWAGLPLVTRLDEAFASRVAASLLTAVGLPELITRTTEEYEALAYELATQPERLNVVKEKLARQRLDYPLFRTDLYVRHLEQAFEMMVDRQRRGLAPDHLVVPE